MNATRNILILGGGGREHALAWKLRQSARCGQLYIAPGNAGAMSCGINLPIDPIDFKAVAEAVRQHGIDMVVVGPEEPLVRGLWDYFQAEASLREVLFVGPSGQGARLEGSKSFAKAFMQRHGIPTASYKRFTAVEREEGLNYIASHPTPIVLKADGLAAGKGVLICPTRDEAAREFEAMLNGKFGEASAAVVVEQFLHGVEFSVFALTDGERYVLLPEAKDYKRIGEGDSGLNTGGMGAVSPVPFCNAALMERVTREIVRPTIAGLQSEGIPYRGFVFFGLMLCDDQPYVIEYNCRLGDPETEAILPRLESDLLDLLEQCASGKLQQSQPTISDKASAVVVLASEGYPGAYAKGREIKIAAPTGDTVVFHAGTRIGPDGRLLSAGGRVLAVMATAPTLQEATLGARAGAEAIQFEGKYFRRDIGADVLTPTTHA
ncbi:MAG: phosphoribosylamine--glycine ligase [Saprospiraceae bacterium]